MKLETDLETIDHVDAVALRRALATLDGKDSTRAILSSADEIYLQTAFFDNGYVIEKRVGNEERHFHAVPVHPPLPPLREKPRRSWLQRLFAAPDFLTSECAFTKDRMIEIFVAYLEGRLDRMNIEWSQGYCDR